MSGGGGGGGDAPAAAVWRCRCRRIHVGEAAPGAPRACPCGAPPCAGCDLDEHAPEDVP
eukprot:gene5172-8758_t